MNDSEQAHDKLDYGKIRPGRLKEITYSVTKVNSDMRIAIDSMETMTKLLNQSPYLGLTELMTGLTEEEPVKLPDLGIGADVDKRLNPFSNAGGLVDKLGNEDKADLENAEDILPGIGKLIRRTLYVSIEYRVAREYVNELKSNPEEILQSLGQDVDLFSKLNERFKVFIDFVELGSVYLEDITKKFVEKDLCSKLELPVLTSVYSGIFGILTGGTTRLVSGDDPNVIIDDKGIGMGYIITNTFMYNTFPELIPKFIEIKRRVNSAASCLREDLVNNLESILERANAISGHEYVDVLAKSLYKHINPKKNQDYIKKVTEIFRKYNIDLPKEDLVIKVENKKGTSQVDMYA